MFLLILFCKRYLLSEVGPIDFALKNKVINDRPFPWPTSPFWTLPPDVPHFATVVTSFWKSKRFTCLFFWTLCILSVPRNGKLTVLMWIVARRSWSQPGPVSLRFTSVATWMLFIIYRLILYRWWILSFNSFFWLMGWWITRTLLYWMFC